MLDSAASGTLEDAPDVRSRSTWTGAVTPWRLLALVGAVALMHLQALKPFVDVDLYWHVRLGEEILAERRVSGAGSDWAYTFPDSGWTTTQWLAEVLLALVHDAAGWDGIAALRVLACTAFALALAHLLLRGRRTPWAAAVYVCTVLIASTAFQERPLLASLLLTVWLARLCERALAAGVLPRPVPLLLVTWLWANLHGQWVVVPGCLGLLALGLTAQWWPERRRSAFSARAWALVLVALVAGALTPVGPRLLLAPLQFRAATDQILEWRPTSLDAGDTVAFGLLVAALVVCWARSTTRVRATEVVFVLGLCAFAAVAVRNVVPAAVLLAPLVVRRLQETFPRVDRVDSEREQRALAVVAGFVLLVSAAVLVTRFTGLQHVPSSTPVALATRLGELPGEQYVLNDYNTGGAVIYWAGPGTRVAVDGRADRYGGPFLAEYQNMMNMREGWETTLDALRPNTALLEKVYPLGEELVRRGWSVVDADSQYVLLEAPGGQRTTVR